jgi:hypothetical protein
MNLFGLLDKNNILSDNSTNSIKEFLIFSSDKYAFLNGVPKVDIGDDGHVIKPKYSYEINVVNNISKINKKEIKIKEYYNDIQKIILCIDFNKNELDKINNIHKIYNSIYMMHRHPRKSIYDLLFISNSGISIRNRYFDLLGYQNYHEIINYNISVEFSPRLYLIKKPNSIFRSLLIQGKLKVPLQKKLVRILLKDDLEHVISMTRKWYPDEEI